MHKMRIMFDKEKMEENSIDSSTIISEVEDLGFDACLLHKYDLINQIQQNGVDSPKQQKVGIEQSIQTSNFIVKGMTCAACSGSIENHFNNSVKGVIQINVSLLTHKASVKHDASVLRPRQIISEIEDLGFEAELEVNDQSKDIRDIVKGDLVKYKRKLMVCASLYLPIALLVWIVPNFDALKSFMTSVQVYNGNTLYVFLVLALSSCIQFYLGSSFYSSGFKSIKHKSANMDVLIIVSTTSAWLYGVILLFKGYTQNEMQSQNYDQLIHAQVHNWETSSVLIFIVILGKYIEAYSKTRTIG